ncbi:TonB-dependent receptor domain-containing protein [Microbulbifer sp. 2304DJ12-6]|uniref:TonB-dependent receptor n=1 Tax=Microbulbifer sp. 2304DJ12-6 TaxID=3233340 RepID=UPI0039AF0E61
MIRSNFQKSLLVLAIGGLVSTAAMAEDYTTGTLRGTLQDQSGTPVENAEVLITSDKGVRRTTTTDSEGNIRIPQLPIGQYKISISQDGYNALIAENVAIQIGKAAAYTFTMEALDTTIEEVYVTGVRQDSWDFNSTTTGITVDVGEIFARTPIARSGTAVALLAPGTSAGDSAFSTGVYGGSGDVASIAGASVGENAYYVNGMNITNFRNFVGGSTIPFELYDQIEVKTGGYQAEFGRSTGGVLNAVTKSGSNEFHFGANIFLEPEGFYETAPATYRAANQHDERSQADYNIWASGAIIEDKLFFFGLYNPRDIRTLDCFDGSCLEETQTDPFYAVKLDFVPFEGHRFEYTLFSDDQTRDVKTWRFTEAGINRIGDATALGGAPLSELKGERLVDSKYVNGGENQIFKYTAALADWVTVSAMYGENRYNRENFSDAEPPWLRDQRNKRTGENGSTFDIGVWAVDLLERGEDERKNYRFDADFYFNAMGEHHIRVGVDKEDLASSTEAHYSGNLRARLQYDKRDDPYSSGLRWRTRQYYNEGAFSTIQTAFYIQDSWQVLDNLTLNMGLRNETFDNRNIEGDTYVEIKDQLAPRLGFSWDPFQDGNTRVYGSYGHYYLPIASNTNMRLAGQETYFQEYKEAIDADGDGEPDYDANGFPVFGEIEDRLYFADGTMPFGDATHDEDLDPLYQSEYILGFEHTFADEWTFGVAYIYRNLESLIEDVAIDAAVIDWAEANGYGDDPALETYTGFHQYVLINPGQDVRVALVEDFGNDGVVDWAELSAEQLGYPEGKRTYDAIDLTLERIWDGQWYLSANYTWSKSEGNYEGAVKSENGQDDAGLTQDFDQPGLTQGAFGPLPNDRRHRLKVRGAYAINDQLSIGANLNIEAPRKMGCLGEHPTDVFAWDYGASSWYCGNEPTPRGSQIETDWVETVDLSLMWTPQMGDMLGNGKLALRMDVFNLFNHNAVVDRHEFGDLGFSSDYGAVLPQSDPNYGKPTRYQTPRHVRLSASYNF